MVNDRYITEVQRIIDFAEAHLTEEITVKSLCRLSIFSQWEFQRIFRACVGDSIGAYLRGRKLSLAAEELTSGDARILDVAIKYQFSSQESFSRAFKDYFGFNPGLVKQQKVSLNSRYKPRLDQTRLNFISSHISQEPKVRDIDSKLLVGMKMGFTSTLASERSVFLEVSRHWEAFNKVRKQIKNRSRGFSYGVISAPDFDMNSNELNYFSGVEVRSKEILSENMELVELKKQKYAVFEISGNLKFCSIIADFIYGIWFPQSQYKRAKSVDLQIYDHQTFQFDDTSSKSLYCVPIE